MPLLWLAACTRSLPEDQLCKEIGYAIAGRTEECTGDRELASARFEAFEERYTCAPFDPEPKGEDTESPIAPEDLFHCPLAIRNLPCELVEQYGDDLSAYLTASPICATIIEEEDR
jgi:hypothetical protein